MGKIKEFFSRITGSKRNLTIFLSSVLAVVLAAVILTVTLLGRGAPVKPAGPTDVTTPTSGTEPSDNSEDPVIPDTPTDPDNPTVPDPVTPDDPDWEDPGDSDDFDETMPAAVKYSPNLNYRGKTVGILTPATRPAYYDKLVSTLRKGTNATVTEIPWSKVSTALNAKNIEAVIIPDAGTVPYGTVTAVKEYLSQGGKLLTLGGPAFQTTLYSYQGKWLDAVSFMEKDAANKGRYILSEFNRQKDLTKWSRNASSYEGKMTFEIGDYGCPTKTTAAHIKYADSQAWDMLNIGLSGRGYKSIGFWAKGGKNTPEISIEVRETDGARWYTSLELTQNWKYYVLGPKDFTYWPYDTTATGRGDEGDTLNVKSAASFQIGISHSFSTLATGEHEFWLDSVCFLNYEKPVEDEYVLEGLSPEWKYYPVTNGATCTTYDGQVFVGNRKYALPSDAVSMDAGTQGLGFAMGKMTRYVPLIEIYDKKGLRSGALAWMNINSAYSADRVCNGSMTACFGTSDPKFYNENGLSAVLDVVRTMLNDALFTEAGTTEYIHVDSETSGLDMGAYVRAKDMTGVTLDVDLASGGKRIAAVSYEMAAEQTVKTHAGTQLNVVSTHYELSVGKPDTVMITLKKDGKAVDRVVQKMNYWSPKPASQRHYITKSGGEFRQNGKALRIYGVNLMPNVAGVGFDAKNDQIMGYHENWWSDAAYDPDKVYKQLKRIKEIGFNAVSINGYIEEAREGNNLLHFVNMCDSLGLYVDCFVGGSDGVSSKSGGTAAEIIKLQHLAEFDNIIAYDIAWERTLGGYEGGYSNANGRKVLNESWVTWVIKNYGSVTAAEKIWGESMPRSGDDYVGPTDAMISSSESSPMVAAFRRFADEYLSETYSKIIQDIRQEDSHHLISSRAGAPSGTALYSPGNMVYDAQGLASVYDFYSPEFYDEGAGRDKRDFAFVNLYAQFAMPDSPVVWKEFGESVWEGSNFLPDTHLKRAAGLKRQVETAKAILDSALSTHATAVYWWCYNPGYRAGEESDCGVVNPDGSDRPVAKLFREYRSKFMNQKSRGKADVTFTVDRDKSASGWKDMYAAIKTELLAALDAGKTVALKDAATGTNTANVSDAAIGGCGKASAVNPARYVGGEFKQVEVRGSDGIWRVVKEGDHVTLPKGKVDVRVTVQNTQRAEWLSSGKGAVSVISAEKSGIKVKQGLKSNVKYLGKITQEFRLTNNFGGKQTSVALRFQAEGRFEFGTPFTFVLTGE